MSFVWRWVQRSGTLLVIVAILGGSWYLLEATRTTESNRPRRNETQPTVVTVAPATRRPVQRTVEMVGSLYGWEEIDLAAKVSGRVQQIYYDVGALVRPGDLLLAIDPTDFELGVRQAERALQLELARLGRTQLPEGEIDLSQLPSVVRAIAREQEAKAQLERVRQLANQRAVSAEERDAVERNYAVARADHRQAILDAQTALAGARERQAALETARQRLKDAKVRVPGQPPEQRPSLGDPDPPPTYVICERNVSEGEMIQSEFGQNTTLFSLVIDHPLKLKASVPERYKSAIQVDQQVLLQVEAYPEETFTGRVARVNPAVDRTTRAFEVEVHVANPERRLSPGSFVEATVLTSVDTNALTVPEEALVSFAGVTKVFVLERDVVRAVPVEPGVSIELPEAETERMWIEVEGDLTANAQVVTSGQSRLSDGAPAKIRAETASDHGGNR